MNPPVRVAAVGLVVLGLIVGGCSKQEYDWQQDVYVWQRTWSESTLNSVVNLSPSVDRLRLLLAQYGGGQLPVAVDLNAGLPALSEERAIVSTVRIDGSRLEVSPAALWAGIESQLWSLLQGGVNLVALEIDHDTATAAVGDYADWLAELRLELPDNLPLWITALPDWQHSPDIGRLLDGVDRYTLQVHSVDGSSLMDGDSARGWVDTFSDLSNALFYVAVPTYQLRAGLDRSGSLRFVEGETAVPARAGVERMLFMPPRALAEWISSLKANPPNNLLGVAWFRLPVAEDRANISLATLNALIEARELVSDIELRAEPVRPGGRTYDLSLVNHGPHDSAWPAEVRLPADCGGGEGANGFQVQREPARLVHSQPGLLRVGDGLSAGWVRCQRGTEFSDET